MTGLSFCLAILAWLALAVTFGMLAVLDRQREDETPLYERDEYREAVRKVQGR